MRKQEMLSLLFTLMAEFGWIKLFYREQAKRMKIEKYGNYSWWKGYSSAMLRAEHEVAEAIADILDCDESVGGIVYYWGKR